MQLNDIRTIENVKKYKLNIELFEDVKMLRLHIKSLQNKDYYKFNKEYYKVYMRERYRKTRVLNK